MRLTTTVFMHSWGKFGPESYKETKKPNSSFWGAWSNSRVVHMSHTTLPRGCAKHLSHSLGLTPGHISTLTPYKEQAYPSCGASKQGSLLFVLTFSCCSRGPSEAMSEFVVWPLVNFCWLGEVQEPWLGRVTSPMLQALRIPECKIWGVIQKGQGKLVTSFHRLILSKSRYGLKAFEMLEMAGRNTLILWNTYS